MPPQSSTNPVCRRDAGEVLDMAWGRLSLSASRQVGNSTTLTFGRVTIRAGEKNPRHRHPNCDEVLYVLSGQVKHSLGEEVFLLEAGDTISIPKYVWHQATAVGEQDADIVICFSSADRMTEIHPGGGDWEEATATASI